MGMPAMAKSTDRKRRSSSGERLVTPAIVVEVDKKRGGACSGHRLDRMPPDDTPLVSAPLYGRCLLVEANLCAIRGGPEPLIPSCDSGPPLSRGWFSQHTECLADSRVKEHNNSLGRMSDLSY